MRISSWRARRSRAFHDGMWSKKGERMWSKGKVQEQEEKQADRQEDGPHMQERSRRPHQSFSPKGWVGERNHRPRAYHSRKNASCPRNVPPALQACLRLQREEPGRGWKELTRKQIKSIRTNLLHDAGGNTVTSRLSPILHICQSEKIFSWPKKHGSDRQMKAYCV